MYRYWAMVRNDGGAWFRVECMASNHYEALQIFKMMYGDRLMSENANYIG